MTKHRIECVTGLVFALACLAACGRQSEPLEPAKAEADVTPAPLPEDVQRGLAAVAETMPTETSSVLVETGELVSPVRSELSAKFPGRVGRVFVDDGARVRKGQPLLEIESDYLRLERDRAEAALARNRAAVEEARRDFERKQDLLEKGSVSQALYDRTKAVLDQAEAALAEAEASRALAQQRLDDVVLVSPIDGIVAERRTDVGERLGEATVAFVIVQVSPLRVRFRLPERYLASVQHGQIVRARVDPYPEEIFEGRVTNVVRAVDAATRSFVVEAEIPNRDERLKPGLFARVELDLDEEKIS
ncbi:MAG TPA: efflux RND transporter periplasmic adaptor subunit [Vicinamibacteria bacterium]|nr:efflux RND transporter periplasmic adaptor subunit [Vicinamibacteria bacterium]